MQRRKPPAGAVVLLALLGTGTLPARAQSPHAVALTQPARPRLEAAPRTSPVRVDGRLDEAAWQGAPIAGSFVQGEPVEGAPVDQPTEVRVLFDDDALYIGARMYDDAPETIARQMVRRDEGGSFDNFEVYLDPNLDRRTGYRFRVSAAGVQGDSYLFDDTRQDNSWDAVWESGVQIDDLGWTAEMRIPLSQLRFQPVDREQTWGLNFVRRRVATNERSYFSLESRLVDRRVSVYGDLTGLRFSGGVSRLELRPYALARSMTGPAEEGDPFFEGSERGAASGLDLRYGLGPSFTLNATFNPDFGQVEVDPAVVNLSADETIYPERRPFFVEDARIFEFDLSGGSLFYSRRIGREPSRSGPDEADFVDAPGETAILGAAKLTGRTPGGLSAGLLAAVTDEVEGRAYFAGRDSLAAFTAEPRAHFGVARLQQELRGGASVVGGMATLLDRRLPGDGSFDFLPRRAAGLGVDWEHTWRERAWALTGFVAGSHVTGAEEALIRIQRSSRHYFQRPDARDLRVDSSATSMTGLEWRLELDRRSGEHWTGGVWIAQRTPGFEANDLGEFSGGERLDGGFRLNYREITPGALFRDYRVGINTFHNWRHEALDDPFSYDSWGRAYKRGAVNLSANATFLNYWGVNAGLRYNPARLDDQLTRGGPLMANPGAWNADLRGETDSRRPFSLGPSLSVGRKGAQPLGWSAGVDLHYRPTPQVSIRLEPEYAVEPDAAQYVTAMDDAGFAPTFGRRYLFADLDRRTFSLDTRLDVTFTPRLTLQLFTQPLLSVGDFESYKQLAAAESHDFLRFPDAPARVEGGTVLCAGGASCLVGDRRHVDFDGDGVADFDFEERDFRIRSLRGNAVLRWEYRPGSTLFLVWQQSRLYEDYEAARFDLAGEAGHLLTDAPLNQFVVKMNYWWGL